jgi:DNA-binding beta-propeller fold protein YncE
MTVISADTNEITGTIETGISPCGIGIDSSKSLAYVTNFASVYIAVVDKDTSKELSVFIPKGVKKVDIIGKDIHPS